MTIAFACNPEALGLILILNDSSFFNFQLNTIPWAGEYGSVGKVLVA